jgi:hypothetical protein
VNTPIRQDVMRPSLGRGERQALSLAAELAAEWLIVTISRRAALPGSCISA